jgi:hypothetical protein
MSASIRRGGWKKAYLGQMKPAEIQGEMKSPEEMAKITREQHKEIEYLKRQSGELFAGRAKSFYRWSIRMNGRGSGPM